MTILQVRVLQTNVKDAASESKASFAENVIMNKPFYKWLTCTRNFLKKI